MARPGLYKSDVKQACAELAALGRRASVDAVRVALGNRGSKTTIHKYLKELEQEAGTAGDTRSTTASTIRKLVDELADQLHRGADDRLASQQAAQAATLRQQAARIDMLQQEVERLNGLLLELGGERGVRHLDDMPPAQPRMPGFGVFNSLTQNDRAGVPGFSKFDALFNSRASVTSDHLSEQGENLFWRI